MTHMMNLRYLNTIFFFGVLAAVTWGAYLLFAPFANALFMAAILAILFYPLYKRIVRWCGNRVQLAASVMLLVVALTIILPVASVSVLVISQVAGVVQTMTADVQTVAELQDVVNRVGGLVPGVGETFALSQESLAKLAQQTGSFFVTVAQKTYASLVGSVLGIFVLFFTLFYFFVDGERLMRTLMFLSPLSDRHERLLFESFSAMSRATIKGTLIIGTIQGSLGALVLFLAGVHNILIWWVVMIFFAIIPLFGAGVVGFPFALYYFMTGNIPAGTILVIGFAVISFLDNYLRPLIVGRDMQMHTLLVFFATLGGIMTFGLFGFIVGPIIMALFVTLWQIYALEFKKQLEEYNSAHDGV